MLRDVSRLPYLIFAAALVLEAPWLRPQPFQESDLLFAWYAGRLVSSGASPYDAAAWSEGASRYASHLGRLSELGFVTWPYPPWTAYLFAPFGLLPPELGAWALHLALLAVGVLALVALTRRFAWPRPLDHSLALAMLATFQPFVHGVRFGQFDTLLLAGVVLVLAGLESGATLPLALGALLLATKPHLVTLVALAALALLVRERRWRAVATVAAALAAVAGLTVALQPGWPNAIAAAIGERTATLAWFSSTWSLALAIAGGSWLPVGAALVMGAGAAVLAAVRAAPAPLRDRTLLAGALVASLALAPNVYAYDHLLLAPAACVALFTASRLAARARTVVLAATLAVATLLPWVLFYAANDAGAAAPIALVPLAFAMLLVAASFAAR